MLEQHRLRWHLVSSVKFIGLGSLTYAMVMLKLGAITCDQAELFVYAGGFIFLAGLIMEIHQTVLEWIRYRKRICRYRKVKKRKE